MYVCICIYYKVAIVKSDAGKLTYKEKDSTTNSYLFVW